VPRRELPRERLIPLMVGRALERQSWRAPESHDRGPVVLTVDRLSTGSGGSRSASERPASGRAATNTSPAVTDASFVLHGGEIVGLVGLVGAGRSELALALIGAVPQKGGTMTLAACRTDRDHPATPNARCLHSCPRIARSARSSCTNRFV